ncbi:hypothetical protein J3E74DRAFT_364397 [Bipolaris maydis]|nr:hypothetical protein J3E74DRAFT_364397 [Bipolaris maydis]
MSVLHANPLSLSLLLSIPPPSSSPKLQQQPVAFFLDIGQNATRIHGRTKIRGTLRLAQLRPTACPDINRQVRRKCLPCSRN